MNKEITPLEALKDLFANPYYIALGRIQGKARFNRDIQIIEKSLKALEIIKKMFEWKTMLPSYEYLVEVNTITQEEIDLLKEVLK